MTTDAEEPGTPPTNSGFQSPPEQPAPAQPAAPPPPLPPTQPPTQVVYNVTQAPPSNGLAVAALVLGIIGLILFFSVWGGIILGALAIVFGALGRANAKKGAANGGLATAGLVLGIVAVVASFLFLALVVSVVNDTQDLFDQVEICLDNPNDPSC